MSFTPQRGLRLFISEITKWRPMGNLYFRFPKSTAEHVLFCLNLNSRWNNQESLYSDACFIEIAIAVKALTWLKKKKKKLLKGEEANEMWCNVSLYKMQQREFISDLFATVWAKICTSCSMQDKQLALRRLLSQNNYNKVFNSCCPPSLVPRRPCTRRLRKGLWWWTKVNHYRSSWWYVTLPLINRCWNSHQSPNGDWTQKQLTPLCHAKVSLRLRF